jgi:hypothetical protein
MTTADSISWHVHNMLINLPDISHMRLLLNFSGFLGIWYSVGQHSVDRVPWEPEICWAARRRSQTRWTFWSSISKP